ncbi:protein VERNALIZATION INSENSITIVE [Musa troglodytarum]|uniref:Protein VERNALIZATION INSENSITIVE n=1 Tax=Musa troglodytarum TaxID=320322 RepID=A0A9E7FAS2_9LILI|nr:protein VERNALIZATION INSENSITIVE [Musa troglodytarum]URD92530.1 protein VERNALIZATION INSENSITIVE [Musa troglodytarum]
MDPPFSGFALDPSKCSKLSIEEKRDLVRELSKWPESASEKLQTWSRRELLEILCTEIGKERKYTSLTKQKMIEFLFRVVSDKRSEEPAKDGDFAKVPSTLGPQTPAAKRQRKNEHPSRLAFVMNNLRSSDAEQVPENTRHCLNSACRAILNTEDAFCKRCSCCICHEYDDNKDPSLWLFCGSETTPRADSCGLSCHLECALKHEGAGIMKSGQCTRLDGSYYCPTCGKANDLLGSWKKQLMIAKDARRVDVLCYRISLSHKLLGATEKYQSLHEVVDTARKKLEAEVGPIDDSSNMARGIVNRLSVAAEVQKLCTLAVDLLDSIHSSSSSANAIAQQTGLVFSSFIKFEQISSTSVSVVLDLENNTPLGQELAGFNLWHRKADISEYPDKPSFSVLSPEKRLEIAELSPATDYMFKVVAFSNTRDLDTWEVGVKTEGISPENSINLSSETTVSKPHGQSPKTNGSGLSNPSEGDECNANSTACADLNKLPKIDFDNCEKPEILGTEKSSGHGHQVRKGCIGRARVLQPESLGHSDSALDEEPNSTVLMDSTDFLENNQASDIQKSENESDTRPVVSETVILPAMPCGVETGTQGLERYSKKKSGVEIYENGSTKADREPGSSSEKRGAGKTEGINVKDRSLEGAYEYCVKVIRWLECQGHMETNFRVKFLTWFSLWATLQERRIVSVYVDTLIDDPASLAGQLVDTFSEAICSKRPPTTLTGFCTKLQH